MTHFYVHTAFHVVESNLQGKSSSKWVDRYIIDFLLVSEIKPTSWPNVGEKRRYIAVLLTFWLLSPRRGDRACNCSVTCPLGCPLEEDCRGKSSQSRLQLQQQRYRRLHTYTSQPEAKSPRISINTTTTSQLVPDDGDDLIPLTSHGPNVFHGYGDALYDLLDYGSDNSYIY